MRILWKVSEVNEIYLIVDKCPNLHTPRQLCIRCQIYLIQQEQYGRTKIGRRYTGRLSTCCAHYRYRKTSSINRTKSQSLNFLVSSCSCLRSVHWSHALSWEWRCSWSSADRRCSNYIRVINNFIAYYGATYTRGFTVGGGISTRGTAVYPVIPMALLNDAIVSKQTKKSTTSWGLFKLCAYQWPSAVGCYGFCTQWWPSSVAIEGLMLAIWWVFCSLNTHNPSYKKHQTISQRQFSQCDSFKLSAACLTQGHLTCTSSFRPLGSHPKYFTVMFNIFTANLRWKQPKINCYYTMPHSEKG